MFQIEKIVLTNASGYDIIIKLSRETLSQTADREAWKLYQTSNVRQELYEGCWKDCKKRSFLQKNFFKKLQKSTWQTENGVVQ